MLLKKSAQKRQTQNVSAVKNLFPGKGILPLANVELDLGCNLKVVNVQNVKMDISLHKATRSAKSGKSKSDFKCVVKTVKNTF